MRKHSRTALFIGALLMISSSLYAINTPMDSIKKRNLMNDLNYQLTWQESLSQGKTPLWMASNHFGLGSLKTSNGYLRASVMRPLTQDSTRHWGLGYGVDLALPHGFTSKFIVQQAFVDFRWHHGLLTIGAKEQPMELKEQQLSSGSQTLGINSRPIPEVRISLPSYWVVPFTGRWLRLKGHIAYGISTEGFHT